MKKAINNKIYQIKVFLYSLKIKISYLIHPVIYIFCSPYHCNMGDQAQTYCIEKWMKKNYPGYIIRFFDAPGMIKNEYSELYKIRKHIKKRDLIFVHSGYRITDLYPSEEQFQRKLITLFKNKKIVFLPTTIYYESEEEKKKAIAIYNSHPDITILCRDEVSFNTAKELFPNCKLMLYPDIVTSMIGKYNFSEERKGILFCLRNDKESIYSEIEINKLIKDLETIDTVNITDTTIDKPYGEIISNRAGVLENIWKEYASKRIIITDRYHGTIFSLIAGTPVIVLSSSDHKLSSGVKWFPEDFSDYICHIPDLSDVIAKVEEVYSKQYSYSLPAYFEKKYYDKLKEQIK